MPTTLIFYGTDAEAAKAKAVEVRASKSRAQLRHAQFFCGEKEPADAVLILPCVSSLNAERIRLAYGIRASEPVEQPVPKAGERTVTSKGRGRGTKYFVTEGDQIVSGPYDSREEAGNHLG